ncbi:MAG TPA: NUDIX hydrolase [Chlorobaculum sp.]|nr:NUDIX hydrolase [Chlorobaculum sp.]
MSKAMADDPGHWETLDSKYLHQRPWLTLRQEKVLLPGGRTIDDYYVHEFPAWVSVLALTKDRQAVLIRQYRHGLGRVSYELPAGVHEDGESLMDAARRELLEETGYSGGTWSLWMELSPNPATQNNISYTFLAEGVERSESQSLDPTEQITVHPVPLERLHTLALNGDMIQALHIAPVLKYLMQNASRRD